MKPGVGLRVSVALSIFLYETMQYIIYIYICKCICAYITVKAGRRRNQLTPKRKQAESSKAPEGWFCVGSFPALMVSEVKSGLKRSLLLPPPLPPRRRCSVGDDRRPRLLGRKRCLRGPRSGLRRPLLDAGGHGL